MTKIRTHLASAHPQSPASCQGANAFIAAAVCPARSVVDKPPCFAMKLPCTSGSFNSPCDERYRSATR
jgi:hypothetical protein